MSLFHLPRDDIFITLDDVLCMRHLLIRVKLLDHDNINRDDALESMVDYLGVNPRDALQELEPTEGLFLGFHSFKGCIHNNYMIQSSLLVMTIRLHNIEHTL